MIPIIDSPKVVRQFASYFHPDFSYHQAKRFQQYLTGIITDRKATVRSIASRLIASTDQSTL